jgi:NAD(P)-dependent dehydrogenase (short-subunit alcohol dehydrogenase family)
MVDSLDMTEKVVLVTGGTKGVGRGVAEAFLERGAHVVVCGRTEPEKVAATGDRAARFVAGDVRDPDQIATIVAGALAVADRIDVLVNNAGGAPPAFVAGSSPRLHSAIITLNLVAPLLVSQQVNEVMQAQSGGGLILNIASVNGTRASPGMAAYGAAKAGLLNLTETLAAEWAPKVRVNAVTAGSVITDELFAAYYGGDPAKLAAMESAFPSGRMTTPTDIGGLCVFLASPLAANVSGANLLVHGGGEPMETLPQP